MDKFRPGFEKDDSSKLEKLQKKLYSPNQDFKIRERRTLSQKEHDLNPNWNGGETIDEELGKVYSKKGRFNVFTVVFVLALVFFIASIGYGLFAFFQGLQTVSGNDVDITIIGPVQIGGGEELSIDVIVQNNNQVELRDVELIIEYPRGTKNPDSLSDDLIRERENLGEISPNSIVKKTKRSVLFGEEGDDKEIHVKVEYKIPDSGAVFEKIKVYDIALQSSPIRIGVNNIKEISSSQEIVFDVEVNSNSDQVLENVLVKVEYPFGFSFTNSSLEPIDEGTWLINKLNPRDTETFKIYGILEGQNNEERIFRFETGLADSFNKSKMEVVFTSLLRSVTIKKSFFGLDISIDGNTSNEIVIDGGKRVVGKVIYNNNLDDSIYNATIEIVVSGNIFDERSIDVTSGFYDSSDNKIIWTPNTDDKFRELAARREGSVGFSFSPLSLLGVSNPEINMEATVRGRRVNESNVEEEIVSTVFKNIKFNSEVETVATTFYSSGSIPNSGPNPPKVEQKTTYTIQWDVFNTSNDLSNAKITAKLPEYVDFTGTVFPNNSDFSYDDVSKTVVWNIGNITQLAGYELPKKSASFQVSISPSLSQLNDVPVLVRDIEFRAQDTFTKSTIIDRISSVTTKTQEGGGGKVGE